MELYFQGRALLNKGWTPEYVVQARGRFERALALDPENIDASVGTAIIDIIIGTNITSDDSGALLAKAEATLIKAISAAPRHAFVHLMLGAVLKVNRRAAEGIAEFERALALDRNLAEAHAQIGNALFLLGRGAETEVHVNKAFQLSPRDVFVHRWLFSIALAKFQLKQDAEGIDFLLRSIEANRTFAPAHFTLAARLALLGSREKAHAAARAGLAIIPS
jgi:tetratricopeptide (TPR) repeat protein